MPSFDPIPEVEEDEEERMEESVPSEQRRTLRRHRDDDHDDDLEDVEEESSNARKHKLQQLQRKIEQLMKESSIASSSSSSTTTSAPPSYNNNDSENKDPRASFHIGLELFGQEPQIVERTLQTKLEFLEQELHLLQQHEGAEIQQPQQPQQQTPEQLHKESAELQEQIRILRGCSQVRVALDESIQLSMTWSSTVDSSGVLVVSSSTSNTHNHHSPLVESAKCLVQAQHLLDHVQQQQAASRTLESSPSCSFTVKSLQQSIQQQRVHLVTIATSYWKVELFTRNEPSHGRWEGGLCHSLSVNIPPTTLHAAYETMEALQDNKLHLMVRHLVHQLYQQVLKPTLDVAPPSEDGGGGGGVVPPSPSWRIHQVTGPPNKQGVRLEWYGSDEEGDDDDENKEGLDSTANAASTIQGGDTPELVRMAHWKHALELWTKLLAFVANHVVLQRPDLLQSVVGPYLFGTETPKSQQPQTASQRGALLGRMLKEYGLHSRSLGDECGGLVLEPLIDAMTESCVPSHHVTPPSELFHLLQHRSQQLKTLIHPFVRSLVSNGWMIDQDSSEPYVKLFNFPTSLGQAYVDLRHCTILQHARDSIQQLDYHNTIRVGDGPSVSSPDDSPEDTHRSQGTTGASSSSSSSSSSTTPLSSSEQQRQRILQEGMAIFQMPDCSISVTASEVMKVCRSTMDEAVEISHALTTAAPTAGLSSSSTALLLSPLWQLPVTLYRAAREVLDIFRAMVNLTYGSEIEQTPRTAAIFHNDCVYLAHHCLTLGLEYKDQFPSLSSSSSSSSGIALDDDAPAAALDHHHKTLHLLRQSCVFVDMVPLFRDLADKAMGNMLHRHATILVDMIGPPIALLGPSLRSDEILVEWSEAETALENGLHHVRQLYQAWKPILATDVLVRALWYVSDVILTLYLDQILHKTSDISSSACQFIHSLFQTARHNLMTVVGCDEATASSVSRVVDKFAAIEQFMNMTLAEVQEGLINGTFRTVLGSELSHLIVGAFDDTPKRKNLLALLAKHT